MDGVPEGSQKLELGSGFQIPGAGFRVPGSGSMAFSHQGLKMPPRFACPCCGFLTLPEEPPGTFGICEVCYGKNDNVQYEDVSSAGGANAVSLSVARTSGLDQP